MYSKFHSSDFGKSKPTNPNTLKLGYKPRRGNAFGEESGDKYNEEDSEFFISSIERRGDKLRSKNSDERGKIDVEKIDVENVFNGINKRVC